MVPNYVLKQKTTNRRYNTKRKYSNKISNVILFSLLIGATFRFASKCENEVVSKHWIFDLNFGLLVEAAIPDATIQLYGRDAVAISSLEVTSGNFGPSLPFGKPSRNSPESMPKPLILPPAHSTTLCSDDVKDDTNERLSFGGSIVVVARGECSFVTKVLNAQKLGAGGVIVYNNLAAGYSLEYNVSENKTEIVWPIPQTDFECANGRAMIPSDMFSFDPSPYDSIYNDKLLSGVNSKHDVNLCATRNEDGISSFMTSCDSQRCFLTGVNISNSLEACCAWDISISMGASTTMDITIPSVFLTMEQGDYILQILNSTDGDKISVIMYDKFYPTVNASSFILWIFGTLLTWFASWLSTKSYKKTFRKLEQSADEGRLFPSNFDRANIPNEQSNEQIQSLSTETSIDHTSINEDDDYSNSDHSLPDSDEDHNTSSESFSEESRPTGGAAQNTIENEAESPFQNNIRMGQVNVSSSTNRQNHNAFELKTIHAVAFLISASATLFILFYFKLYNIVRVMYGIGCSTAVAQIIFRPIFKLFARKIKFLSNLESQICAKVTFCGVNEIQYLDILSVICGFGLGATWIWYGFAINNANEKAFYWITQNIMGVSICILFLTVIRLNSIKVATALLIAAFIYDIFFVFITPYVFEGDSIMVVVATSGGPPDDPQFCEKYPDDSECQSGDPLPMLLTIPRIGDFRGGMSLLGLGDIVLPGLLLSFAARFDAAKRIVRFVMVQARNTRAAARGIDLSREDQYDNNSEKEKTFLTWIFSGYLTPLTVAYAVGLGFANMAVYLMNRGQPALLYIVPCCLLTMVYLGWRRKELKELWVGPKEIRLADKITRAIEIRGFRVAGSLQQSHNSRNDNQSEPETEASIDA
mmetsp:Transcript_7099/g.10173  ORF Transcript_7099/g.10173 Transcript_7099/m.10173 type:complete len:872 (+) Transcript_7099:22-2637(+)